VEAVVYLLCAATAATCSWLLLRGYRRSKARLLLWCAIFFLALTLENVILFFDLRVVGAGTDLSPFRRSAALVGTVLLLYGLIWEGK
jgi:hypothetical protein